MSELRKANDDCSFFITFAIVGWIYIFTRTIYADIILDSFKFCRKNKALEVHGYVIMSSHVHLLPEIQIIRCKIYLAL